MDKKIIMFDIKEVHFSDNPFNIKGCDSVVFEFCRNKVDSEGFTCQQVNTLLIDLTQDLEVIWRNIHDSTKRYIKRAEKDNVKIRVSENYDQFYQIYRSFIQKKGMTSLFQVFGVATTPLEMMRKYGTLFIAEYDGEILSGEICLEDRSTIELLVTASKRLDVDKEKTKLISCANRLLHWEIIKYAKDKHIDNYDFGGLWPAEEAEKDEMKKGINSFKLSFGGEIVTRYHYHKNYSKLYNIMYHLFAFKKL
jgi:hypothetical protein